MNELHCIYISTAARNRRCAAVRELLVDQLHVKEIFVGWYMFDRGGK